MRTIWAHDNSAVKIFGDFSPHPIIATAEVAEALGGAEKMFHEIHRLRRERLLPRANSCASFPFSLRDIELAQENEERGRRYWRWGTLYPSPREYIRGYYWIDENEAVFSDGTRVPYPGPGWETQAQAARRVGVSLGVLSNAIASGKLETLVIVDIPHKPGSRLVRKADVDRLFNPTFGS